MNKGKKSVAVNLRDPAGRDLVQALATRDGEEIAVLFPEEQDSQFEYRIRDLLTGRGMVVRGFDHPGTARRWLLEFGTVRPEPALQE